MSGIDVEKLVVELREWGLRERAVLAIALAGSHHVDPVIVVDDSSALAKYADWTARFGTVQWVSPVWAATEPCDPDALAVVRTGFRIVYDPRRLLRSLAIATRQDCPERHEIRSTCGRYERQVWFAPSRTDGPHELAVFLDGEFYLHDIDCLPVIREHAPSLTCAFVSFRDAETRHTDYTCSAQYSRFIAEDLVAWAKQRDGNITGHEHLICGLSLSGLAAAYTAQQHPSAFAAALCQSGSFWLLADHEMSLPTTSARFWLSVGTQETETNVTHPPTGIVQRVSQIEGVESAARSLASRGAKVHYNLYSGGHTFVAWRDELAPALRWLAGSHGELTENGRPVAFGI
jgi:iron(III)-enterobactin esterase